MATVIKKFQELTAIGSGDIENSLNYFYIIRPNESLAVDKDSIITLENLYYLLDSDNAYYNSGWFYKAIGEASLYDKSNGVHAFFSAVSGVADDLITFIETMRTGLSINGSKVASVGKDFFEDWDAGNVIQLGGGSFLYEDPTQTIWGLNAYFDGAWKYVAAGKASRLYQKDDGSLVFESAATGAADDPIAWLDAYTVSPDAINIYAGAMNFLNHEEISLNGTITLEKYEKIRTVVLTGAITQLTINRGTDVDESNTVKIINNTSGDVVITDGLSGDTMDPGDTSTFFFSGSTIYRERKRKIIFDVDGTIAIDKYADNVFVDVTSAASTLIIILSSAKDNVKIFVRNETAAKITVKDAITTNTFYQEAGTAAEYGNAAGVLLKTSPSVDVNGGKISVDDYDVFPIAEFSASGTFAMVPGQYLNFINITGSGVTVTIDRTPIFPAPANRYLFVVRNISSGTVYVADVSQTIELKASNSFIFRLRGADTLEFVTPRTSYQGIVDPRDQLNGFIHANAITHDTIFETLKPFLPNSGDIMKLNGTFEALDFVRTASFASRFAANVIRFHWQLGTGITNTQIFDNSADIIDAISISW